MIKLNRTNGILTKLRTEIAECGPIFKIDVKTWEQGTKSVDRTDESCRSACFYSKARLLKAAKRSVCPECFVDD